jgi:hypothetical protein
MKPEMSKSQRRRIRELAGIAYDRELARELVTLEAEFVRWHSGRITSHDLSHRIHEFDFGPARRLFSKYSGGSLHLAVAAAIAEGILTEGEAGPDLMDLLRGGIEIFRTDSSEAGGSGGEEVE